MSKKKPSANDTIGDLRAVRGRVLDAVDLEALLESACGAPKRKGKLSFFSVPWRSDSDPSLALYLEPEPHWVDFGDRSGGNAIDFVMRWKGVTFIDALRDLAEQYKIPMREPTPEQVEVMANKEEVERILTEATDWYAGQWDKSDEARALRDSKLVVHYGWPLEVIERFKIGWAPAEGGLYEYLRAKGFADIALARTGLVTQKGRDYFLGRIVFPYTSRSRTIYMIARQTEHTPIPMGEHGEPGHVGKYIKLLQTLYVENPPMWGLEAARKCNPLLVIAEGIADAISVAMLGIPCCSPVTTRFGQDDVPVLLEAAKRQGRVILLPDQEHNDAGMKGALATATELVMHGFDGRIAVLPHEEARSQGGKWKIDGNEFIRDLLRQSDASSATKSVVALLEGAPKLVDALISEIPGSVAGDELEALLKPILEIAARQGELEQERIVQRLADTTGIRLAVLRTLLEKEAERTKKEDVKDAPIEDGRPVVHVTTDTHQVIGQAIDALCQDPDIYARGSVLTRVVGIEEKSLTSNVLGGVYLPRTARWLQGGKPTVPGDRVIKAVLELGIYPKVRQLTTVTDTPVMRPDGTILSTPGYDEATGTLLIPGVSVDVPDAPTVQQALSARDELLDLISDFPMLPSGRGVWFSILLSHFGRHMIDGPIPAVVVDATTPGTGKGKSVTIASTVCLGSRAPGLLPHVRDEDEQRKRILPLLRDGHPIILVDDLKSSFGGGVWDPFLTAWPLWQDRVLGVSETLSVPSRAITVVTGNNVVVRGDTVRRVIHCRLETTLERPEDRKDFKYPDIVGHVRQHRERYVRAVLTILRAWVVNGRPEGNAVTLGSFEAWASTVGAIIKWLGLGNVTDTQREYADRSADTATGGVASLLVAWRDAVKEPLFLGQLLNSIRQEDETIRKGIDDVEPQYRDFRTALVDVCPGKSVNALPEPGALSKRLGQFRGRCIGGLILEAQMDKKVKQLKWSVCMAETAPPVQTAAPVTEPEIDIEALRAMLVTSLVARGLATPEPGQFPPTPEMLPADLRVEPGAYVATIVGESDGSVLVRYSDGPNGEDIHRVRMPKPTMASQAISMSRYTAGRVWLLINDLGCATIWPLQWPLLQAGAILLPSSIRAPLH